jgi:phosphohistidine phosphatase SixA
MENSAANGGVQNLFVMRHGERMDDAEPSWVAEAARPWDPPLTEKGHLQAQEKGKKLRSEGFLVTRILVSPFLRCVQTTAGVIKGMYPDGTANSNLKVGHPPQF